MPAAVTALDPVAATARLVLRRLHCGDADFILELLNEPAFVQYIGDKGVRNAEDAREYLRRGPIASYQKHGHGLYAVELRDSRPVGICGLVRREGLDDPDVGFAFLARYRGRGYATESAAAMIAHARDLQLARIVAITDPMNSASIAVLGKIGLKLARRIRLDPQDIELNLYALDLGAACEERRTLADDGPAASRGER